MRSFQMPLGCELPGEVVPLILTLLPKNPIKTVNKSHHGHTSDVGCHWASWAGCTTCSPYYFPLHNSWAEEINNCGCWQLLFFLFIGECSASYPSFTTSTESKWVYLVTAYCDGHTGYWLFVEGINTLPVTCCSNETCESQWAKIFPVQLAGLVYAHGNWETIPSGTLVSVSLHGLEMFVFKAVTLLDKG